MAEDPKANVVGKKSLRDKFNDEAMGSLPQNLLAPQNGSASEDQTDHETFATGETSGGTLVNPPEPFKTEPFGSPRWIYPKEAQTPRNLKNFVQPWCNLGAPTLKTITVFC